MKHPPLQVTQLAIIVSGPILASIFVGLRIYARRIANIPLRWDDWTIIAASVLSFALIGPSWRHVLMWNLGYHVYDIPCCVMQPDLHEYYIVLITTNLINIPIVPLVKVSLILLLMRASAVISWLKKTLYGILIFTVGCALFPWILYIFVCPPSNGNIWESRTFGNLRCLGRNQQGEMLIFTTCANLLTDLLILPIPFIIARRMMSATIRARLVLLSVFLCGLAVTGIGAAKIYLSLDERLFARVKNDWTHNINYSMNHIENNVAIILANIPVLRGLVGHWMSSYQGRSGGDQSLGMQFGSKPSVKSKPKNAIVRKLFPGMGDRFRFTLTTRREKPTERAPSPEAHHRRSFCDGIMPVQMSQHSYTSASSCEKGNGFDVIECDKKEEK